MCRLLFYNLRIVNDFKPLLDSLPSSAKMAQIIKRAERLNQLDQLLQKQLPAPVKGMVTLANLRGETAIVLCKTQMEASKVRMYSRSILQILQNEFKVSVKKIKVKVENSSQN